MSRARVGAQVSEEIVRQVRAAWRQLHAARAGGAREQSAQPRDHQLDLDQLAAALGAISSLHVRDPRDAAKLETLFGPGARQRFAEIMALVQVNCGNDVAESGTHGSARAHALLTHGEEWLRLCRAVLSQSGLKCVCPWTGETLLSSSSVVFAAGVWGVPCYAYYFTSTKPFYLVLMGHVACRLLGLYLPENHLAVSLDGDGRGSDGGGSQGGGSGAGNGSDAGSGRDTTAAIYGSLRRFLIGNADNLCTYYDRADRGLRRAGLLVSYYQFAHHLWNELSAIEGLLDRLGDGDAAIFVMNSPFGPLSELFPTIAPSSITERFGKSVDEVSAEAIAADICWLPLGRCHIPRTLTTRLIEHARSRFPNDVEFSARTRDNHQLVIWISTRSDVRIWRNQADVIAQVLDHLATTRRAIAVVFDGYTPGFRGLVAASTLDREGAIIREIVERTRANVTFISLLGARLGQALVWGGAADVYIANHGTIQHKIGWFYDVPGVCHYSPPRDFRLSSFPGAHASPGRRLPNYVYGAPVEGAAGEGRSVATDPREDVIDYDIDAGAMIAALDDRLQHVNARTQRQPAAASKTFCHITESYYEMEGADAELTEGDRAWASGNHADALHRYATSVKIAPKYLRAHQRLLEYLLMNFVAWFPTSELAETRVAALRLILTGLNPDNAWVQERLLGEILTIPDTVRCKRVLADTAEEFPKWRDTLIDRAEEMRGRRLDIPGERFDWIPEMFRRSVAR